MGLSSAICKLFRFISNLFGVVVETVATALKTVGAAAVDVLTELAQGVGDALGISGTSVLWIVGGGALLYLLFSGKDSNNNSGVLSL